MRNGLLNSLGAILLLPSLYAAQAGDGSEWTGGGGDETVTLNVTQNSTSNDATVTYTDSNGTSGSSSGTLGHGSTQANPNVSAAGEGTTPTTPSGEKGTSYRVKDGKVQRKNDRGVWVNMKRKAKSGSDRHHFNRSIPSPGPWWHPRGRRASASGGEEVTSLPH